MLFLYSLSVTTSEYRWKMKYALHFIPFLSVLLFLALNYYIHSSTVKMDLYTSNAVFRSLPRNLITQALWIQAGIYVAGCLILLRRYRAKIKSYYSSLDPIQLSWLSFLLVAFFVWKGIFLTGYLFQYIPSGSYYTAFQIFIEVGFLFYASMIVYKALQSPVIFSGINNGKKYRTSPLTEIDKKRYLERMETTMQVRKPFLVSTLTLKDLSKQAAIPVHYISQILNETLKQKFYDYVNRYRIEEFKRLLSEPNNYNKTILEVMYDVGFNSKSVFNTAFKKHVGMTPKEFKKLHQN